MDQMEKDGKELYGRRRIKKQPVFPIAGNQPVEKPEKELSTSQIDLKIPPPVEAAKEERIEPQKPKIIKTENPPEVPSKDEKPRERKIQGPINRPKPQSPAVKRRPLPSNEPLRKEFPRKPERPPVPRESNRRPDRPKISVVIPAYNEAENLPALMEYLEDMLKGVRYEGEVLIVNDGSTDKTAQILADSSRKYRFLRVLNHPLRRGLTEALETGFNAARGDIFVFYPADLQYLPNDIPAMIQKIDNGSDIVCGWRQGNYGLKKFVSFCYNTLSRILFKVKVHDLNSVKAFRREVVNAITLRRDWHRYMVVVAASKGFTIDEVKVKLYPRRHGKSKFGFGRILVGFFDLLSVKFQLTFLKKPLLLFGTGGLLSVSAGIAIGIVALYLRYIEHDGFRPLLYLVILLIMVGISLFALGFLAEAMVGIIDELRAMRKSKLPH